MKKYVITFLISIIGIIFAQEQEQFYTIQLINERTEFDSNFVGYLNPRFNNVCGAQISTENGKPLCAVIKIPLQPEKTMTSSTSYYKIVPAQRGIFLPNFVGWLEDNSICNLLPGTISTLGSQNCAVVRADFPETILEDNEGD